MIHLLVSVPTFIVVFGVILFGCVCFLGGLLWGSFRNFDSNPSQQDTEEAEYLKDFRQKKEAPIIDIDEDITSSIRFGWRERTESN